MDIAAWLRSLGLKHNTGRLFATTGSTWGAAEFEVLTDRNTFTVQRRGLRPLARTQTQGRRNTGTAPAHRRTR